MTRTRDEIFAAEQARQTALARIISAKVMGLLKDPLGEKLPEELTTQNLDKAKAILTLLGK